MAEVKLCDGRTKVEIEERPLQEVCKDFNIQVQAITAKIRLIKRKNEKDKMGLYLHAKGLPSGRCFKMWDAIKIAGLSKKIKNGCKSWTKGGDRETKFSLSEPAAHLTVGPDGPAFMYVSFFAKDYKKLVSNLKSIGINNNAIKLDYDLKPDYYERSSEDSDYYSDDSEGTEYWWEEYLSPAGIAALGLGGVFEDLRKAAKAKFERTHATTVKLCDREDQGGN